MKYKFLSPNIIVCEDFLPHHFIDLLYMDLLNNRGLFNTSRWYTKEEGHTDENILGSSCGGLDFWVAHENLDKVKMPAILGLAKWFFNQGLGHLIAPTPLSIFHLIKRDLIWNIHVVTYNKDGYYNWHADSVGSLFTFNLILQKPSKLKGGNMLFRDEKLIEVKNCNNFFSVFPSYVPHAVTPLIAEKDVSFAEQRFSIQYWASLKDDWAAIRKKKN